VAAVLALTAGVLVYVLDRPAGTASLLPSVWHAGSGVSWFGPAGAWLPSLVHAFAFSVLTALALPWRQRNMAAACLGWAGIDTLAEIGQHAAVSPAVTAALMNASALTGGHAVAEPVARYFANGSFDVADVAAGLAGCLLAYAALRLATRCRPARNVPRQQADGAR
jgi:hypothetical protein